MFSDRYTYFPPVSCNPEDEDDAPWCTLPAFYGTGLPGRTVPLFPVDDPFQSPEDGGKGSAGGGAGGGDGGGAGGDEGGSRPFRSFP